MTKRLAILVTGKSRWILNPDGDLLLIGMVHPLPYRITGAIQPRRWPRKPIRYTIDDLLRFGHELQWYDEHRQLVQITQCRKGITESWKYRHWME